jgi:UDP-N-acetylglucosamine diphosphorylase / glucose-1-phosphate thymidylyltransferase / UDP-N-acetylgalactosamine diphosphorylase / glucosamine-1-phosphate N-acetyltransferase / galactosamine-1-phosphate N-acetyltransferase
MRVAFVEDSNAANFHPLTLARPVFELVCGQYSLRERIVRHCEVSEWGVFVREHLAETYREEHPEAHVNDFVWLSQAPTVIVNGLWLPTAEALHEEFQREAAGLCGGHPAFFTLEPFDAAMVMRSGWDQSLSLLAQAQPAVPARGMCLEYAWDLVRQNAAMLQEDYRLIGTRHPFALQPQVAVIGRSENFHIAPTARIEPFVVLDASDGPITIGPGAVLEAFTRVAGPCHIDHGSRLLGANVRGGTTIGPNCRVGGEVEASILHGYVNKYHAGFLGHSYICPWVNLGALTTNSDLRNDYSHVRVPVRGASIDTGLTKMGCFIADHTKTSIGTLLNTGSSIGAMSMILPDGQLAPRHIPSFCKVIRGELTEGMNLEPALRTARATMERRNCELTAAQEQLWRRLYVQTRVEREDAILRVRERDTATR